MEKHSIQEYLHIGAMNWYLVQLPPGTRVGGDKGAVAGISDLEECIKKADLKVSFRAGYELWTILEKLKSLNPADQLPSELTDTIQQAAKNLEHTLVAEASERVVFVVTEKRIDIERLIHRPQTLLSANVWRSMPRVSAYDFVAACKAIAYELPTAGAFHLLRCLEGIIRHYYMCSVKRDRLLPNDRMWGPMIKQLRERKRGKPPDALLDVLDRIRVNFRNPTSHPDKLYDSDEVQDLFGLCVDALNRIVKSSGWSTPEDSIDKRLKRMQAMESNKTP